jgi:hypothetical protein
VFLLGQTGEPDPHKLISLAAIVPLSEVGLFISGDRERDLEARELFLASAISKNL